MALFDVAQIVTLADLVLLDSFQGQSLRVVTDIRHHTEGGTIQHVLPLITDTI